MQKPFTKDYVINTTLDNMLKAVDYSTEKTFQRIQEFEEGSKKASEAFSTLLTLNKIKEHIRGFKHDSIEEPDSE